MITKSEVYKSLIRVQKESGQGLSGIVKIKSLEYTKHLDTLIQEGLVKACHTGGSIGHPESNIFYMPTKGYNVWEDDGVDGQYYRLKGRYLQFVRLYLGLIRYESRGLLEPGLLTYLQNPELMKEYSEWLVRNNKSLKEMLELSEVYDGEDSTIQLELEEIEWVKTRGWYKDGKKVSECLKLSMDGKKSDLEQIAIITQLISLYKMKADKYGNELKESEKELKAFNYRDNVNIWLKLQDPEKLITDII